MVTASTKDQDGAECKKTSKHYVCVVCVGLFISLRTNKQKQINLVNTSSFSESMTPQEEKDLEVLLDSYITGTKDIDELAEYVCLLFFLHCLFIFYVCLLLFFMFVFVFLLLFSVYLFEVLL
jgi:hypothetical protein